MNIYQQNLDFLSPLLTDEQAVYLRGLPSGNTEDGSSKHLADLSSKVSPPPLTSGVILGRLRHSPDRFLDDSTLKYVASRIIDKHTTNLLANLPLRTKGDHSSPTENLKPLRRDLLFLGIYPFLDFFSANISTLPFFEPPTSSSQLDSLGSKYSSICLCIDSLHDLSTILHLVSFDALVTVFKSHNIGLQLIVQEEDSALRLAIYDYLIKSCPTALYGLHIFINPDSSPLLLELYAHLTDEAEFGRLILGEFGTSSDEMNQIIQSTYSLCKNPVTYLSTALPASDSDESVILVGGGPSVDQFLPYLKSCSQKGDAIIAAGSSIGTLLRHGINVTGVVLLERGSSVYHACNTLIEAGYSLSDITLFASITTDPRLPRLFKRTCYYHRPRSVTSFLYAGDSAASSLQISGPEAVNAAVEILIKTGFRSIHAFGCDFGSPSRTQYRAIGAIGDSPRGMTYPMPSNSGGSIYSDPTLYSSYKSLSTVLRLNPSVSFYRVGLGARLEESTYDSPNNDIVLRHVSQQKFIETAINSCIQPSLTLDDIINRLHLLQESLKRLPAELSVADLPSKPWSIQHHRRLAAILSTGLDSSASTHYHPDYTAQQLLRPVIYSLFAYLYDSSRSPVDESILIMTRIQDVLCRACEIYVGLLKHLESHLGTSESWDPESFASSV